MMDDSIAYLEVQSARAVVEDDFPIVTTCPEMMLELVFASDGNM